MAKPPRIAFWGNFGTGNWGNECTLQAIVHNAREWMPDAELLCVCSEPTDTEKRHGLRSFPISYVRRQVGGLGGAKRLPLPARLLRRVWNETIEWAKTVQITRGLDAVVMTGTGMLTDDSEGAFGLPYDLFKWALAAKASGTRVLFASVGVEPIDSSIARFFIVNALRLADYRSYRDGQSRDRLAKAGFTSEDDHVYPDLAFSLPRARGGDGPAAGAAPKIAVGVYNYVGRGQHDAAGATRYRDYLEKLASFVMWLLERDYGVRVIIGDLTYDEAVVFDLREVLRAKGVSRYGDRFVDQPAASVDEVMRQIGEVEVVVASRFHNVLLALLLGKPVVSIAYNEKNDALMGQMGLAAYCQSIDALDLDRLIEQFSDIRANAETLRAAITRKAAAYRGELDEQYRAVFAREPRAKHSDGERLDGTPAA
jgi:polysaccharide pyruvyl transferase WcaK-like protein